MAALQRLSGHAAHASTTDMACSFGPDKARSRSEHFPVGLRVLVVDDDITCLNILERMLRRCMYHVKTCSHATAALKILRESKGYFDLVLSDVHMPDMDGFKLLELVGLEMDLPVIMISVDMSTSAVMRGVRHGACDYLIKPIREEELKNIWQHVVRKKWNGTKELEHSGSLEGNDWLKRGSDDAEYTSSVNEGSDVALKVQRKRSNVTEEDDGELENDDPATAKKPRVVWSVELHQQFVNAVNQLGIDKAVPKRILELMNVPGLTRENVASHLQKFRLYLKRLSVGQSQGGISNSFCGSVESNLKSGSSLGRFDLQPLAVSGQIPPQALASLQAELFGQTESSLVLPVMDQQALLQAPLQGSKCIPFKPGVGFSQPVIKSQSNMPKSFAQSALPAEDISSVMGAWPYSSLASVTSAARVRGFTAQNGNILGDMLQQQHQNHVSMLQETNRSINVQPSCLVVHSHSPVSFLRGNSPASSVNQSCSVTCSAATDCSLLSPQSNNSSLGIEHGSDGDPHTTAAPSGYSVPGSRSPSLSSCSMDVNSNSGWQVQAVKHSAVALGAAKQLQGYVPYIGDVQDHPSKSVEVLDQGPQNLEFVGKGTYIPSRFAVDELESPSNSTQGKICSGNDGNRLKQEPNLKFVENVSVGMPRLQNFSSHDLMGVFSE